METMSDYKIKAKTYLTAANELKDTCIAHITNILKNVEGKRLFWDDATLDKLGLSYVFMCFNCDYTYVTGVNLAENGRIMIEFEGGMIYVRNIYNAFELYELCDFLDCFIKENNN